MNEKLFILDGAMGTMLQREGLSGNSEHFNMTHPDVIASIHRQYIEAGADIIETNTFGANAVVQKERGMEDLCRDMALAGARIARREADAAMERLGRRVLVAGSVGPTTKSLTLPSDYCDLLAREYSFDDMASAYREQIGGLLDGGVDMILVETCFDSLNAKAALYALRELRPGGFPAMVSATVSDSSGRTLTGLTLKTFHDSVEWYGLSAFGINCALGAEDMVPLVAEISDFCEEPVICYPNAGLPNADGGYDETPAGMAEKLRGMSGKVNIIGGCCGTTPEHIAAIREVAGSFLPRPCRTSAPAEEEKTDTPLPECPASLAEAIAHGDLDGAMCELATLSGPVNINIDGLCGDPGAAMQNFCRYIAMDPSISERMTMTVSSRDPEVLLAAFKNIPFHIKTSLL